jgi:Glycosyltransferase family 87
VRELASRISAYLSLALVAGVFLVHTVIPAANNLSHGFMAYYVAGQTIREEPGTRLYDDAWFAARVIKESHGLVTDIYLANPPALAVAWLPLSYLTAASARRVWMAFSVLSLALSLWLIAQELRLSRRPWAVFAISALFTIPSPTREQFLLGQMYAFLLLLHVMGWRSYLKHRDAQAGIFLGLALVLKVSGWPIGVLLLAQQRWVAVRWALATVLAGVLLSVPWVGLASWVMFLVDVIPRTLNRGAAVLTAYQDTTGFWQHLFRYVPSLNPRPLLDAPLLATTLTLATILAAGLALTARSQCWSLRFVAAVALSELLSPAAEQYHYIILLLPLAVLWHSASASRDYSIAFCALAATVLIAWPIDYKLAHPIWSLLHNYPRLIGGWITFAGLLIADRAAAPPREAIARPALAPTNP